MQTREETGSPESAVAVTQAPTRPAEPGSLDLASALGNRAFGAALGAGALGARGAAAPPPSPPPPGLPGARGADPDIERVAAFRLARASYARVPVAGSDPVLARTLQRQARGPAAVSAAPRQVLQRIDADDERLGDPGFLLCTALCYLGVPPSIFKDVVAYMLEAASQEAKSAGTGWQPRFNEYRKTLYALGKFQLFAKALRFVIAGELPPFGLIKTSAALGVRTRLLAFLVRQGVKEASVIAAEQIIRKVSFWLEVAAVATCASYCGGTALGKATAELADAIAIGLAEGLNTAETILRGIGEAVGNAISDTLAGAVGMLDPANWTVSAQVPQGTRNDLNALGWSLFALVRPGSDWAEKGRDQTVVDAFIKNASKPISKLTTADVQASLLPSIARTLQSTLRAAGSDAQISAATLSTMSPLGLASFLVDNGLISYRKDPVEHGRAVMTRAAQEAAGTAAE